MQNEIQTLTQSLKKASEVDRSRIEAAIAETSAALEANEKTPAPPAPDMISSEAGNDQ